MIVQYMVVHCVTLDALCVLRMGGASEGVRNEVAKKAHCATAKENTCK